MVTLAQSWYDKGWADGWAEGRAEGRADALLALLEWRFGDVPEDAVVQVRAAGIEDIDRWVDAAFDAKDLTDIFRNGVAH